ncbi:hypothetical protein ACFL6H_04435 [Candidatus Latescibacterota bacterium]
METKIKIKLGPIEVEYEGTEKFLKEELTDLIKTVIDLYQVNNILINSNDTGKDLETEVFSATKTKTFQYSTQSIAAKLSCKKATDLILAAATKLTLVDGKETFMRQELLDEIKTAPSYYKNSYNKNLTSSLNSMLKNDKLNEPKSNTYALTAASKKEMERFLA